MALAVIAAFAGYTLFDSDSDSAERPKAARPDRDAPRGYQRFRDRATGLSIAHPASWIRLNPPDDQVRLIAAKAGASVLMRVATVGIEIDARSVGPARQITDRLVREAGAIRFAREPEAITLAGLPGYLYLYTFRDRQTRQQGVHAHYFLFRGKTLISLVLQALPAAAFGDLTKTFDRIAESFRVGPQRGTGI